MLETVTDTPTVAKRPSDEPQRPLGGYAVLTGVFGALAGAFAAWVRHSGRKLPDRVDTGDLVLLALATHKLSRLISKDRVTSAMRAPFTTYEGEGGPAEVKERPRGSGLRRAIGELVICPYCIGLWISGAFTAGLILAPRATRCAAAVFAIQFGSDTLQIAYKKMEDAL